VIESEDLGYKAGILERIKGKESERVRTLRVFTHHLFKGLRGRCHGRISFC